MTGPPIRHITRRVHQEPPIRDDSGTWLGGVILFCIVALVIVAAVWSALV